MNYKGYDFEIVSQKLIPPIRTLQDAYRFAAKITFTRSPKGKILHLLGEYLASTEKEAEQRAVEAAKKWIDNQIK